MKETKILVSNLFTLVLTASTVIGCSSTAKIRQQGNNYVMTDKRDGEQYQVAYYNGKWWMMENFRGKTSEAIPYKDNRTTNTQLGETYPFETIKDAAPKGWRLPTANELADLFLSYCVVSYAGELPVFREKFGPYEPDSTRQTFQKLQEDHLLNLPIDPHTLDDWNTEYTQDFRTLFWSNDVVGNRVYAIHWNAAKGVHFSTYPKNFYGFVRYIKEEKTMRAERRAKRKNKKRRQQEEQDDLWNKFQFE